MIIKIEEALEQYINGELHQIVLSGQKASDGPSKVKIRPVLLSDKLLYQASETIGRQEFHKNLTDREIIPYILKRMTEDFKQLQLSSGTVQMSALVSKKGKVTLKMKKHTFPREKVQIEHNRKKRYILEEGQAVPFLVELGVMTNEGKIVHARYDKFRQINRFLEFVRDILPKLPKARQITIIDFGCGKSYLTFALYYYLHELEEYDIQIIGLDLKEDVINHCNRLAEKYGYENLKFCVGDIASYEEVSHIDMVVALHACDTATDYALAKAVKWGAEVILSVPCCQHELNGQIENEVMAPVFSYGILKERMAALMTDGIRAELLKEQGYQVQILEFIDMEHTPKNLLIRAVKGKGRDKSQLLSRLMEEYSLRPTLVGLLDRGEAAGEENCN